MGKEDGLTFLVFNTAYFGDVLLCSSLCQNIKNIWPNSKIIFVVRKQFYEAAKYLKDVDDVVIFDKNGEHKGLFGILKFVKNFKYKKADFSIITYYNHRNKFISKLLGVKRIIMEEKVTDLIPNWIKHNDLLKKITDKKIENFPMVYNAQKEIGRKFLDDNKRYIALCPTTKNTAKDIPHNITAELINSLNNEGLTPILTGAGKAAEEYSKILHSQNLKFLDLTDKTSIYELGCVLKNCEALISADTGTMHLGCAVDTPVIAVFYQKDKLVNWSPSALQYRCFVISTNQTAEHIMTETRGIING